MRIDTNVCKFDHGEGCRSFLYNMAARLNTTVTPGYVLMGSTDVNSITRFFLRDLQDWANESPFAFQNMGPGKQYTLAMHNVLFDAYLLVYPTTSTAYPTVPETPAVPVYTPTRYTPKPPEPDLPYVPEKLVLVGGS